MGKEYNYILESIEEYSNNIIECSKISVLINRGLSLFNMLPEAAWASLFIMDQNTYEFSHSSSFPEEYGKEADEIFAILADNAIIGETLANKAINYFPKDTKVNYENYFYSIPLISSSGPIGIIVLKICKSPKYLDPDFYIYCNILSRLFTYSIENAFLKLQETSAKEEVAQEVAYRTLNLVESKKKLFDKIEDLQSNLSMSIPHEVRTPINQILGFSDFLMKHYDIAEPEEIQEMMTDIHSSAERLKRLFENYLLYANLSIISMSVNEIIALQLKVTPTAQSVIFDSIANLSRNYKRSEDIEFNLIDSAISISEEFFRKIIEEILDNALKYSPRETKIHVASEVYGDTFRVEVRDSGSGMTEEQIENLGAFVQFDRKINEQQGSGLGLSIASRIVDLHNGSMKIDSKKDEYTSVEILLPVAKDFQI